jgi:hypothetical protein
MKNDNSGPAFPFKEMHTHGTPYTQWKGMTLRDYFAAKAMQGFCVGSLSDGLWMTEAAKKSYSMADTMLKAREA